ALDGAQLTAAPGRILGFLGPNGAGKTTAMRAVLGLVALDAGTIHWKGMPVDSTERVRFGYMPEQRGLYPKMRVRDQIAWLARLRGMTRSESRRAATRVLETLGLGDRGTARVEALSHGNQQRAQLAACLVHQPDLLVLDEPFSGLDPLGVDTMSAVVRSRADSGATVLFSSHQLDLVEDLCDDVAIIDRGRVVVAGPLQAVRSSAPQRRVEISFVDDDVTWTPPGAIPVRARGGVGVYLVPAGAEPAALLAAATAAGAVRSFAFAPPRLSEIFREAVGS
ncbi:MAG TPA: ATP-binding cassette domain-containing protein, partial [Acidimicrobiia bacterium]|nr:ATP-binding cassette domain-containing protein [Acidimicrobiia bacterium]